MQQSPSGGCFHGGNVHLTAAAPHSAAERACSLQVHGSAALSAASIRLHALLPPAAQNQKTHLPGNMRMNVPLGALKGDRKDEELAFLA